MPASVGREGWTLAERWPGLLFLPSRIQALSPVEREILDIAATLRATYRAEKIAAFMEEAAEVYENRGLFRFRY